MVQVWAARGLEGNAERGFCRLRRLRTDGEEPDSVCANGNWCILMLSSKGLLGTRPGQWQWGSVVPWT